MKTLLLIPSVRKQGIAEAVADGRHPQMDYDALAAEMARRDGDEADLLDYAAVDAAADGGTRLVRRLAGRDAALAWMGFRRRGQYGAIFTNGENVGIPLALLLKGARRRPSHVTIGHRLSAGKKRLFFTRLKAHRQMDAVFVYARTQRDFAVDQLGVEEKRVRLIAFHADAQFYRERGDLPGPTDQICAAGLEWRDYPTLIEAVSTMPDLAVKLAAASPWSKHADETSRRTLPANVVARRYDYAELRALYAESLFVVVPLYENDFQAGVTTMLEAMAMGKAVVATRTTGQTDVITDGENGLYVAPGDVAGWRAAITRLRSDAPLRERLGRNARRWVEENATLTRWVQEIADALRACAG